jgi:hypothetical protein
VHGRIAVSQVSVALGLPLAWLALVRIPPTTDSAAPLAAAIVGLGLSASWCTAGTIRPLITEIVPPEVRVGLYPIVTFQHTSTTLYQVSYHIQYMFF